jgi:PD-(D/E)XK nuclease superfamily protein
LRSIGVAIPVKPRPIVLNQSSYKTYLNCRRLYGWYRIANLQPVGKRSALEIGTAVHAALALFHGGGLDKADLQSKRAALRASRAGRTSEDLAKLEEEVDALIALAEAPLLEQAVTVARQALERSAGPLREFMDKDLEESLDIVERVIPAYVAHWSEAGELWQPLNQEIQFMVPVGPAEANVWLRGKADNLSVAKGGLYLVDYKTAGRLDPRDLLKYELDTQLTAYIYGLTKQLSADSEAEGGPPIYVRGAIIDVLVKTKVPQFARELFTRTERELEEFEAEWVETCSDIREREDRVSRGEDWKVVFPKNTEHCFRFGTCPFRDVCLEDTPVRRKLYDAREGDYVDEAQEDLLRSWKLEVVE